MLHALRNPVRVEPEDDYGLVLVIGPVYTGALLEVGYVWRDGEQVVVHAMPARPRFLRWMR
jgi:hypothetical protein